MREYFFTDALGHFLATLFWEEKKNVNHQWIPANWPYLTPPPLISQKAKFFFDLFHILFFFYRKIVVGLTALAYFPKICSKGGS